MKRLTVLLFAALLPVVAAHSAGPAVPQSPSFIEKPVSAELMKQLRKGGFVLYLRHGITDNSRPDRVPHVDLDDCSTQRPLSEAGRELMRQVGKSIREAGIVLSRVLVSPMCRTRESARLAIGDKFEVLEPLMYSANMTSEEKKPRIEALKKLLLEPVPAGGNTLILAHAPNMHDLIGFFVKPEGTLLVFNQSGADGYRYLASIHPDDWASLPR